MDGTQLPGLSLSNSDDSVNKATVYTSYKEAADAGFLYHNGNIDKNLGSREGIAAFTALMNTLDYTLIKIDSDLPVSSSFQFDFYVIMNELNLQDNDYYKWDIEYNDHRVLVRYYYYLTNGGSGYNYYGYTLVNEVLLLPAIDGKDYSEGTINHVDFEYGVSDRSVIDNALRDSIYDEFNVAGKAPVDNLGYLQFWRIVEAVRMVRGINYSAGDFLIWRITYSDSEWMLSLFIQIIRPDGTIGLASYGVNKTGNGNSGPSGSVRYFMSASDTRLNYYSTRE
jgi:hypothetical protein